MFAVIRMKKTQQGNGGLADEEAGRHREHHARRVIDASEGWFAPATPSA